MKGRRNSWAKCFEVSLRTHKMMSAAYLIAKPTLTKKAALCSLSYQFLACTQKTFIYLQKIISVKKTFFSYCCMANIDFCEKGTQTLTATCLNETPCLYGKYARDWTDWSLMTIQPRRDKVCFQKFNLWLMFCYRTEQNKFTTKKSIWKAGVRNRLVSHILCLICRRGHAQNLILVFVCWLYI